MSKLASLGGVAGLAGHADSPILTTNPMADITDVYSWMAGSNLNLVMNVSPDD